MKPSICQVKFSACHTQYRTCIILCEYHSLMYLYISVLYSFRSMSLRQTPQDTTVIMKKRLNWTVNSMFLFQTTALAIRAQTLHRTRLDQNWSRMKVWRLIFCLTMNRKGYLTFAVFAAIPLINEPKICKLVCTQLCNVTTDVWDKFP